MEYKQVFLSVIYLQDQNFASIQQGNLFSLYMVV